jgi:glycosyltransferase involved in cell wall biosynthesis
MKILYDHLCFQEKYGGVSKYFVRMIQNLPHDMQYQIAVKYTNNEYIKEMPLVKTKSIFDDFSFKGKPLLISAINAFNSISLLKKDNYDIYHQTHYNPYGYKYLGSNKKSIMTIHDMNFWVIPKAYSKYSSSQLVKNWQKKSVEKANKIIAISQNTKNDIVNLWNVSENKIITIYHGINDNVFDDYDKNRLYDKPYILFVGERNSYKNFKNYLKAFKIVFLHNPDLLLVCTGLDFSNREYQQIRQLNLTENVLQISASEEIMQNLYYNAELFVYPSLYEGFGMPLLEAMSCHCPVICSNTSCFPEIAQDAALYFDPYSVESMADATNKVLYDKELRQKLVQNGLRRKEDFSWKKCAEEHAKAYNELIAS